MFFSMEESGFTSSDGAAKTGLELIAASSYSAYINMPGQGIWRLKVEPPDDDACDDVDEPTSSPSPPDSTFQCMDCETGFSTKDYLTRHEKFCFKRKARIFSNYGKELAQGSGRGETSVGMRVVTAERPFACDVCHARFGQKSHLTTHKRLHTGEKPFACDLCEAKFSQISGLTSHRRRHTGEKPYACNMCDAKFIQSTSLKQHQRRHTGEKPYSCNLCGNTFSQTSSLSAHKRRHTGEKPYSCKLCDARFSQSTGLKQHKRRHT